MYQAFPFTSMISLNIKMNRIDHIISVILIIIHYTQGNQLQYSEGKYVLYIVY